MTTFEFDRTDSRPERAVVAAMLAQGAGEEEALEEIRAWEDASGRTLLAEPPPDAQLAVALRLLNGEELEAEGERLH